MRSWPGVHRQYDVRGFAGPLSVKAVITGLGTWETAAGRFEVGPSGCLIVNDGEEYSLTIDAPQPVETFCIFFARGFVEDAFRAATTSSATLLDGPAAPFVGFFERMQYEPSMRAELLRAHARRDDDVAIDASMFALAGTLIRAQYDIDTRTARLPALKASTRDELRRRLSVAAAVIHARIGERLSVADVATEACLSPFHFHRVYELLRRDAASISDTTAFGTRSRAVARDGAKRVGRRARLRVRIARLVHDALHETLRNAAGAFSQDRRSGVERRELTSPHERSAHRCGETGRRRYGRADP
jgi:AraC-like DNA-binding protein